jgi:hypothetical protein
MGQDAFLVSGFVVLWYVPVSRWKKDQPSKTCASCEGINRNWHGAARAEEVLIGYACDGFAIYGTKGEDGKPPAYLDECNGHSDRPPSGPPSGKPPIDRPPGKPPIKSQ